MATQSTHDGAFQFISLSPLDNIMKRVYTRIILCIPTEKSAEQSAITALLRKGLRKTVEQVPFLDGEVVRDTTNADRLGRSAIRVSQLERLQLLSKDLTKQSDPDCEWKWSFQDLAQENWLQNRFDGNILAPVELFVDPFDESAPVMAAQANFIEGGLLLCAAFHHQVVDGTGVGTLTRLWAQNCREIENLDINLAKKVEILPHNVPERIENVDIEEEIKVEHVDNEVANKVENYEGHTEKKNLADRNSAIEITPEALDRTPLMPKDENGIYTRQHPEYVVHAPPTAPSTRLPVGVSTVPDTDVAIFYFSGDSLARLKDAAKADLPAENAARSDRSTDSGGGFHGSSVPWISTNDALSALLWTSITRARFSKAQGEDAATVSSDNKEDGALTLLQSKLGIATNGRRKLDPPLPDIYLGNVTLFSHAVLPTSSLMLAGALPNVAKSVRASVNHTDNAHLRSTVQFVDALPNVAALRPAIAPSLGVDLTITSWAEWGLNGLDWGHGVGKVERVRLPAFKLDGLCIIFPRTKEGGLEVLVGLTVDAMQALARDQLFTSFAKVV